MARDRAVSAARQGHRPPARLAVARDRQRHFLRHALWLSVAPVAEGPSALEHGLSLVCSLARCLPVREDQPCAGDNGSRAGRAKPVLRPRSSTARALRPRRLAARAVMMPARRSTGANVMRWLTRTGVAS